MASGREKGRSLNQVHRPMVEFNVFHIHDTDFAHASVESSLCYHVPPCAPNP
jgi:hypothetical protein